METNKQDEAEKQKGILSPSRLLLCVKLLLSGQSAVLTQAPCVERRPAAGS